MSEEVKWKPEAISNKASLASQQANLHGFLAVAEAVSPTEVIEGTVTNLRISGEVTYLTVTGKVTHLFIGKEGNQNG